MPSNNKNIIGDLRGRFDPHYKLASNVEGLEKGLATDISKIHKTLSKSFAMQRKTLVRVLGIEKRVNELELQQAAEEQAKEGIDEILNDLGEEVQQEVGDVGEEIEKEVGEELGKEVGGVATKKKLNVKKTKITGEAFKKGTVLDDDFKSRVLGQDEKGEYLSAEERKARFKGEPFIKPESLKPVEEEEVKSPVGEGLKNILNSIAGTTESIKNLLMGQQKADRDSAADISRQNENEKRDSREKKVETKMFDGVKKIGEKILAPVKSIWQRVWDFIKTILLAKVVGKIMDWLSDPKNKNKVRSIFRFIKDWWPTLLTGFLLFGTGLGSLITGTVSAIASFTPMLLGLLPKLLAFLASPIGLAVLGTAAVVGGGMWLHNKMKGDEAKKEIDESQTVKLNKGGQVPGRGPNKDTVPAMLTPGEFVMSRDAVDKWGVDTLAGMNAAAGGTNMPILGGYNGGGKAGSKTGVVTDPKVKKAQEDYMLYWVNKERVEVLGLPPLDKLTYAQGVELTEMMGPGPKTTETSNTQFDFDKMLKTTTRTKTRGDESISETSIGILTEEDKQKYLASNPSARLVEDLKNQFELDQLGADISASAKMNGGGLVQGLQGGGRVYTQEQANAMAESFDNRPQARIQKLRNEQDQIRPGPNGKFSKKDSKRMAEIIWEIQKIRKEASQKSTPTTQTPVNDKKSRRGKSGIGRLIGGTADQLTGNLFDFDKRSGGGLIRKTASALGGLFGGGKKDKKDKSGSTGRRLKDRPQVQALRNQAKPFMNQGKVTLSKIKPPSVKISPPGSTTKKGGNITTLNMGKTSSPVSIDNTNAPPEIPYFSATIMRSSDKIKTLGIMV
jgi:hypothetical protein